MRSTSEYNYLMTNKHVIKNLVIEKKSEQLAKGYNFDETLFLKDFFKDVRDKKYDIDRPILENFETFERTNISVYLEENEVIEPMVAVKSTIKSEVKSPMLRKNIYTKHGRNLVGEFEITQKRLGSDVAKERLIKRVNYYHNLLLAEKEIKEGKISTDDLRRLKRLEILIHQNKELLNYHNLYFSVDIDGTNKSHIKCKYKKDSKQVDLILTPSQMVNHTLKRVVYKRENIGSTVTEFKQNVPKLAKMGIMGEPLKVLVKIVGDSYDLRKTVKDSNGNNI